MVRAKDLKDILGDSTVLHISTPPPSTLSLSEACRLVCEAYDCSPEEAENYLKQELRTGGLTAIDQSLCDIKVHGVTVIDIEASTVSTTYRHTIRESTDDDPGEVETLPIRLSPTTHYM